MLTTTCSRQKDATNHLNATTRKLHRLHFPLCKGCCEANAALHCLQWLSSSSNTKWHSHSAQRDPHCRRFTNAFDAPRMMGFDPTLLPCMHQRCKHTPLTLLLDVAVPNTMDSYTLHLTMLRNLQSQVQLNLEWPHPSMVGCPPPPCSVTAHVLPHHGKC